MCAWPRARRAQRRQSTRRARTMPLSASSRRLRRESLRVLLGAAEEAEHEERAAVLRGGRARRAHRRRERAGRVRVRAVAEHDVEHDRRDRRVARFRREALEPRREVDHRMRPPDRELVGAEVDRGVLAARGVVRQRETLVERCVGPRRDAGGSPHELRFGAVGAAGVEPAQELLRRREPRDGGGEACRRRACRRRGRRAARQRDRGRRRLLERRDRMDVAAAGKVRAEEEHHRGLAATCARRPARARRRSRRAAWTR